MKHGLPIDVINSYPQDDLVHPVQQVDLQRVRVLLRRLLVLMVSARSVQASTTKVLAVMAQSVYFHTTNLWINPGHDQRAGALLRTDLRSLKLRLRCFPGLVAMTAVEAPVARPVPHPKATTSTPTKAVGTQVVRAVAIVAVLQAVETHIDSGHMAIDLQIG